MHKYAVLSFLFFLVVFQSHAEEQKIEQHDCDGDELYPKAAEAIEAHCDDDLQRSRMPLSALTGEPSTYVNRTVNVITGIFHDFDTDMIVVAPEPLIFQRAYASACHGLGGLCHGWDINHFGQVELYAGGGKRSKSCYIEFWEGNGAHSFYKGRWRHSESTPTIASINPEALKKGVTNCASGDISGANNVKNCRLSYTPKTSRLLFTSSDGTVRAYGMRDELHYDLVSETKPNGMKLRYEYAYPEKYDKRVSKISLKNKLGDVLAHLSLNYVGREQIEVTSSDDRKITYHFQRFENHHTRKGRYYLTKVIRPDAPPLTYEYSRPKRHQCQQLTRKNWPDGRYLINEYYSEGKNAMDCCSIDLPSFSKAVMRVKLQKAPVGIDDTPIITHRYFYDLFCCGEGGTTRVYDAYDNRVDYEYGCNHRLETIVKWTNSDSRKIYSKERFFWGADETDDSTNLITRTFEGDDDKILVCRTFKYDKKGNVLRERFLGNLSGNCHQPISLQNQIPQANEVEEYVKEYTYSQDDYHLRLSETDGAKHTTFSYYLETKMPKHKFIWDNDQICLREFYEYDINAVLIKQITDDGSGETVNDLTDVSERYIKYIHPTIKVPFGLPEIVEEKFLDLASNEEKRIRKTVNTFSKTGRLIREDRYDSNGDYVCSCEWEYDSMGNITKETNAIGQVIENRYDANGNLISASGPIQGYYKEFSYDYSNRLISVSETHPDGVCLIIKFSYDYLGNKIASVDPYGNETRYVYDGFGRMIKTIYPPVSDQEGAIKQPQTSTIYDTLNRPVKQIDALGRLTEQLFTAYDKPYLKAYSDGAIEKFEYNLDGILKKSISSNGVYTLYTHDYLSRIIKQEVYSQIDELLKESSWKYNAFHLVSETDANGMTTEYQYDGAGRQVQMIRGDLCTAYEYDALGMICKTYEWFGPAKGQYTAKIKQFDLLDRIIEERVEDSEGNVATRVSYHYDELGNRDMIMTYVDAGAVVTKVQYNSRSQPVKTIDSEGNETITTYRFDYVNSLGQTVPYSETIDPMGIITIKIMDTLGRIANEFKKNSLGQVIQKQDFCYDLSGNLCKQIESVFIKGKLQKEIINAWTYDSCNRLLTTYEAMGTPEQKQTSLRYNGLGQKEAIIKGDGGEIRHEYDLLGRLIHFYALDESFDYTYEYDQSHSLPVRVDDHKQRTATLTSYDSHDRPIREVLGNGLVLQYSYDRQGRMASVILPDNSAIQYQYSPVFLKGVSRHDASGSKIYEHTYDSYDLSANVTSASLVGQAGSSQYLVDKMGRLVQISNSHWSGAIHSFDKVGNILSKETTDLFGVTSASFFYDSLYQIEREEGIASHTYSFDSLNNRWSKDHSRYALNELNQLLEDGVYTYQYDANGNLTKKTCGDQIIQYNYDALDRLIAVINNDKVVKCVYDSQNRRISKIVQAIGADAEDTMHYLYHHSNEIGAYDGLGNLLQLRLLGLGKGAEIGAAVAIELNGITYTPLHDFHGNVVCLIEAANGNVSEVYRYSAFGEEEIFDGFGIQTEESINPWRYSSKRFDEETGMLYFGRRYYDPFIGRWTTADPAGFAEGPNLYQYVMNNPLTYMDLYGLDVRETRSYVVHGNTSSNSPYYREYRVNRDRSRSDRASPGLGMTISRITSRIGRFVKEMVYRAFPIYRERSGIQALDKPNRLESAGFIYINGLWNDLSDGIASTELVSNHLEGNEVSHFHVATMNAGWDFIKGILVKFGYHTEAVRMTIRGLRDKISQLGGFDGGKTLYAFAHSHGGAVLYRALQALSLDERKMVYAITCGTQQIISPKHLAGAKNYINSHDIVPMLGDTINYFKTLFFGGDHVKFLKTNSNPAYAHFFSHPNYQRAIGRETFEIMKKHGGI